MTKLKICYLLSTTEGGTWAFEQLRDLRDHYGHDVSVVLSGDTGNLVDKFKAESIPVHAADFDFMRPSDLLKLPGKILKLIKFLHQNRFDVTQTHLFPSMVMGRIAGWVADVPIRLSMIAGPFHLEAETPRWIDKATAWMDTSILPSCEYSRQLYLKMGIAKHRLTVVYYGPDERLFDSSKTEPAGLRKELGWSNDTPLVGMIAYFYPKLGVNRWTPPYLHGKAIKGHEDFIHAASIVVREFPKTKFLLVGKGWGEMGEKLKKELQSLVIELGLEENIIFTGHRSDIPRIYKDLNVSVQASLNENLGGSIEALLMECPTVVTRAGGLVDTVLDGKTGIQVNVEDSIDLAQGILRLLRDPEMAQSLGKAGRQRMLDHFTLRSTVKDLDTQYKKLYQSHHKGYRLHVSLIRFFLLGIIGFFVALRFYIFDILLLPCKQMNSQHRNWQHRLASYPKTLLYIFYAILGRISPKLLSWLMYGRQYFMNLRLRLATYPKTLLYKLYSFIGRHSPKLISYYMNKRQNLMNWRLKLTSYPKILLYKLHSFLGRLSSKIVSRQSKK